MNKLTACVVLAVLAGCSTTPNYDARFGDAVRQALTDAQIGTSQCYPQGLHLQDVYKKLGYKPGNLPVCEHVTTETLSLPIYPGMPPEHIERVCTVLISAARTA